MSVRSPLSSTGFSHTNEELIAIRLAAGMYKLVGNEGARGLHVHAYGCQAI